MKHGTRNAYTNHGCRCDDCRAANTAFFRGYQRKPRPATDLAVSVDRQSLADLLNELFPLGLTDDCPARKRLRQGQAAG